MAWAAPHRAPRPAELGAERRCRTAARHGLFCGGSCVAPVLALPVELRWATPCPRARRRLLPPCRTRRSESTSDLLRSSSACSRPRAAWSKRRSPTRAISAARSRGCSTAWASSRARRYRVWVSCRLCKAFNPHVLKLLQKKRDCGFKKPVTALYAERYESSVRIRATK